MKILNFKTNIHSNKEAPLSENEAEISYWGLDTYTE